MKEKVMADPIEYLGPLHLSFHKLKMENRNHRLQLFIRCQNFWEYPSMFSLKQQEILSRHLSSHTMSQK
jgi:hypothetical protein